MVQSRSKARRFAPLKKVTECPLRQRTADIHRFLPESQMEQDTLDDFLPIDESYDAHGFLAFRIKQRLSLPDFFG